MLRHLVLLSTICFAQTVLAKHPCLRECNPSTLPMTCHFDLTVEPYQTLSKACHACAYGNVSDCAREDCIYGDGVVRPITVVNRQMPGPPIRVCLNDKIVVDVHNNLVSESTSLHWHGHHQVGTPHMDGVPHVTQCPISPGTTFRYTFEADSPGTHFWHSHSGVQRGDGAYGALIIEDTNDPHRHLYDFDLPQHTVILNDWLHQPSQSSFILHHFGNGDNKPVSMLVNGKGRFGHGAFMSSTNSTPLLPLENFIVQKGKKYRFRLINSGFNNCPMEISADNHTISVIATDGFNLQPTFADSLVSYAGERFDFVLNANQSVGRYWLRVRGLMDCDQRFKSVHQVAIVSYDGADLSQEPEAPLGYSQSARIGKQLNSMNVGSYNGDANTTTIAEISSLEPGDIDLLTADADHTIYIGYDFYAKDNPLFHPAGKYGFNEVHRNNERLTTPQLNHITLKLPPTPLIMQTEEQLNSFACNESSLAQNGKVCNGKDFCKCLHRIRVNVNDIVDYVIFDEGNRFDANHPFHLHGHAFHVMAVERLGERTSREEVQNYVESGRVQRKKQHAPLKDTVTVPDGGFSLLRVKASNPGVWLFHCHIGFHVEVGMAFVMQVGDPESFAPMPPNFPQCGDWKGINSTANSPKDKNVNHVVLLTGVKENDKTLYHIVHNISLNINQQQPPEQGIFYTWPDWWTNKNSSPRDRINLILLIPITYFVVFS